MPAGGNHPDRLRPTPTRVVVVVGTRPNLMKAAPVLAELRRRRERFDAVLVHTGQHYDHAMSQVFLEGLGIGEPDHVLDVGSGSHSTQTARVMERLEPLLASQRPDLVLVSGDVNSTLAAALVAAESRIPVGHIEAGLRSFDRSMPEELNRVLTDQLSDLLFTHSPEANDNLAREGRPQQAIHYVGNTMIDTLVAMRERIEALDTPTGLRNGEYAVVTLHRPALVDGPLLSDALEHLRLLARELPVVLPCHPRTRKAIEENALEAAGLRLLQPLGYLEFLALTSRAAAVITDSGGVQEETTFLGVPCFTLRDNTERPVTVEQGTNHLLGLRPEAISELPSMLSSKRQATVPALWDGRAAQRIVDALEERRL